MAAVELKTTPVPTKEKIMRGVEEALLLLLLVSKHTHHQCSLSPLAFLPMARLVCCAEERVSSPGWMDGWITTPREGLGLSRRCVAVSISVLTLAVPLDFLRNQRRKKGNVTDRSGSRDANRKRRRNEWK